jgi:hypothetical protein
MVGTRSDVTRGLWKSAEIKGEGIGHTPYCTMSLKPVVDVTEPLLAVTTTL